jgi:hypothetical protein
MEEYPVTLITRAGVQVRVRLDSDGSLRFHGWQHRLAVEGIDLLDYDLPRASPELWEHRFGTVEELMSSVDREALALQGDGRGAPSSRSPSCG